MYKVKINNPKSLIFRNLDNEAAKLDYIAQCLNLADRAAAFRFLINRECEYLIGSEVPAWELSVSHPTPAAERG